MEQKTKTQKEGELKDTNPQQWLSFALHPTPTASVPLLDNKNINMLQHEEHHREARQGRAQHETASRSHFQNTTNTSNTTNTCNTTNTTIAHKTHSGFKII